MAETLTIPRSGAAHLGPRWCAAGMLEADHQFRRINGHPHLPKLRAALEAHFRNVNAVSPNEDQKTA